MFGSDALRESKSPFPDHGGLVASRLHHRGDGLRPFLQRELSLLLRVQEHSVPSEAVGRREMLLVVAYLAVAHVFASQKAAP